jgi:hypothetical protein
MFLCDLPNILEVALDFRCLTGQQQQWRPCVQRAGSRRVKILLLHDNPGMEPLRHSALGLATEALEPRPHTCCNHAPRLWKAIGRQVQGV